MDLGIDDLADIFACADRSLANLSSHAIDALDDGAPLKPGDKHTKTDAQGAFAFDGLASRRFQVSARKDELYAGPVIVRVVESTEPVLLQLQLGATFVVHVVADRRPVAGATVTLQRDDITTATDSNGVAILAESSSTWRARGRTSRIPRT